MTGTGTPLAAAISSMLRGPAPAIACQMPARKPMSVSRTPSDAPSSLTIWPMTASTVSAVGWVRAVGVGAVLTVIISPSVDLVDRGCGMDGRKSVCPGMSCLDLCSEPYQGGLVAEPTQYVHADRQAVGIPGHRYRHGRVPGHVCHHSRVPDCRPTSFEGAIRLVRSRGNPPDWHRRRGQGRGKEGVVAGQECGERPGKTLQCLDRL